MAELERPQAALPFHAIERVEQHVGGFDATGQIAIMDGGNAARQRAQKRVIAKTAHAMGTLAKTKRLIKSAQGAGGHGVGRAGNKRDIGHVGQQLTRRAVTRVERK